MKFANLKDLETDPEVEVNGVALDLGEGRQIFVRRAGGANKTYGVRLSAALKPHKFQIDQGTISEDLSKQILYKVAAETLVVGWKGMKDEAGEEIPFTPQNCITLFNELPDMYAYVMETASRAALYRKEQMKQDAEIVEK